MNNISDFFLEYFSTLPKPEENEFYSFGVHPVVCCPRVQTSKLFKLNVSTSDYDNDEVLATVDATVIKDYKVIIHKTISSVLTRYFHFRFQMTIMIIMIMMKSTITRFSFTEQLVQF